jgi:FkbM family methyltransferase
MAHRISVPGGEPADFYLNETGKLLDRYEGPRKLAVDLGAHVGCFSMLAVAEFGFDLCFAVEADPVNFSHLIINIEANGLTHKIFPVLGCVAPESFREANLYLTASSGQQSVMFDPQRFPFVKVLTFAPWDLPLPSPVIDFLKVDIEGAEFETFKPGLDSDDFLFRSKYIDMEMHPTVDPTFHGKKKRGQVKKMITYLESQHFKRASEDQGEWNFYGHNEQ